MWSMGWIVAIAVVTVLLICRNWRRTKLSVFFSKLILPRVLEPALIYCFKLQGMHHRDPFRQPLQLVALWQSLLLLHSIARTH